MELDIKNPANCYRPAPFWSWNDQLSCDELRRQVRLMHDAGLGGFFMHARGGLLTQYLSPEWMACVEAAIDEAEKLGMDAWLYDENGWPSGFGGGLVNGKGEKFQQKYLRCKSVTPDDSPENSRIIAFYHPETLAPLGNTFPAAMDKAICCYWEVNPYYVDNLDPDVVDEFLRVTHQYYYENLPPRLGKYLRGIFTDEPQLSRNGLPWSLTLPEAYAAEYPGCDLYADLPKLFHYRAESASIRIRYYRLCGKRFNEVFMKRIRQWCDAHNWQLTGHHVLEETCQHQISSNGSITAQYRHYHVPGVDNLGRQAASPVAAAQILSSAAQFGQKQIMTESFAASGWACNFSGMRWIYHGQLACGINYLCPHLQSYSLRGQRKRDYPASFFYHQPWWEDYALLNDHFARAGMLLAEGENPVDILVCHPLSSAWKHYSGDSKLPILDHYTKALLNLTNALNKHALDHHYADEIIVDECGSFKDGKICIGKCVYDLVIIPQISNLSGKMVKLLRAFTAAGGTVLRVRNRENDPLTIDGIPADRETVSWFEALPGFSDEAAAAEFLAQKSSGRVKFTEHGVPAPAISCARRNFADLNGRSGIFYFVANNLYKAKCDLQITLPATGKVVEVITDTGEFRPLQDVVDDGTVLRFNYPLAAADCAMFFVSGTPAGEVPPVAPCDPFAGNALIDLDDKWQLQSHSVNLLTLDRCRYRVDKGEWQPVDTISLQARLLKLQRQCEVELEFDFNVAGDFDFDSDVELIIEKPEIFSYALNGEKFTPVENGYLFDREFRKVSLPRKLKPGVNTLALQLTYIQTPEQYAAVERAKIFESEYNKLNFTTELENIYLAGGFSVRHTGAVSPGTRASKNFHGTFELAGPLQEFPVAPADLTTAGLPFFSGKIKFARKVNLSEAEAAAVRFLRLQCAGANTVRCTVNGTALPPRCWEPFAFEVKELLCAGENEITLELTTSLRNTLGPFHNALGESYWVSTLSFNSEESLHGIQLPPAVQEYNLLDLGLRDIQLSE